jgi:subtilisin family serine protease
MPADINGDLAFGPGTTGRTLVLLDESVSAEAPLQLQRATGVTTVSARELGDGPIAIDTLDAQGVVFEQLGVAVVDVPPDQLEALGAAVVADGPVLAVEAERRVYALDRSADYLQGFRDAAAALAGGPGGGPVAQMAAPPAVAESQVTWGLVQTGVVTSAFSGQGIKVAVLDTGMSLDHPDFADRIIVSRSFVSGEKVDDGHGHGTHCIGTSCGPRVPGQPPRYGIAFNAEIHAGKVLSNRGSGSDSGILGGIEWALTSGCKVVSMSLGAPVNPGDPFSKVFEEVGLRALKAGTLIVAAAGNEREQGGVVGHPANCPSIMAVAAVDSSLALAPFSCGSGPVGKVDIAGPGVAVHSSWPMPTRYRTISGTSMATPHVAGIAALIAEATGSTGLELWGRLCSTAKALPLPCSDVGSGLVQAP